MKVKVFQLVALWFALCMTTVVQAQSGQISGKIVERVDGKEQAIPFANILLLEIWKGTVSDVDGTYHIEVKPGNYTMITSVLGFLSDTTRIEVTDGGVVSKKVEMFSTSHEFTTFNVEARKNNETEAIQLMERKAAKGLEQNIGAKELGKTGSSDVATGLSKVAGLSVVGSRHVFVRGMGDRYNSAYLNGMPVASPDPDKKVIPLDIFPTNIVSSLSVKKAFTSDLYGDFSGGAIDIRTKDYPEEPTFNISFGTGYNTNSTFRQIKTYNGGKNFFRGININDRSRNIPASILNTANYDSRQTSGNNDLPFRKNLSPVDKTALPNASVGLFAGNYYDLPGLNDDAGVGLLLVASHGTSNAFQQGTYRIINLQNDVQLNYEYDKYTINTNSSVLGNAFFRINKKHHISYNLLFVNLSSDAVLETDGYHFDYEHNIFSRRMTYRQNNLLAQQISGKHTFLTSDRLTFHWALSNNEANSKEPDRKQLVWLYDDQGKYVVNAIDRLDNHRFFSDLNESEWSKKGALTYVLKQIKNDAGEVAPVWSIEAGVQEKDKTRFFDYRQFTFGMTDMDVYYPEGVDPNDPDSYINHETHDQGVFSIAEVPNPASEHTATQSIRSAFLNTDIRIKNKLYLYPGVRFEQGKQIITFRDQQQPVFLRNELIESTDILPAFIARYMVNEKNIIRVSASKTISRPGFKEVAPFEYTEVFAGVKTRGNPELINGSNYNFDVRFEVYPRNGELIAFSAFGKWLKNPIERTMLSTASGQLQSFQNASSASVTGLEFEVRKQLDSLFRKVPVLRDLSLGLNLSYIHSQVSLDTEGGDVSTVQTNDKRPLQGASPYLANLDLSYEKYLSNDVKGSVALSYNVYGKRITSVGIYGLGDVYELPVNTVNLVIGANIKNKWNFSLKAKNLLNAAVKTEQLTPEGIRPLDVYTRGTTIGASVTYRLAHAGKEEKRKSEKKNFRKEKKAQK